MERRLCARDFFSPSFEAINTQLSNEKALLRQSTEWPSFPLGLCFSKYHQTAIVYSGCDARQCDGELFHPSPIKFAVKKGLLAHQL